MIESNELTPAERELYKIANDHYRAHYCPPDFSETWAKLTGTYTDQEISDLILSLENKGYFIPRLVCGFVMVPAWVKSVIDTHTGWEKRARYIGLMERLKKLWIRSN